MLNFAIVVATAASLLSSYTVNTGRFLLVNNAAEPIGHASVSICGQTIQFRDIEPNKSAHGSYRVTSDSHYTIRLKFKSGRTLQKEAGYVTNGMNFNDQIIITDTDIELKVGINPS